MGIFDSIKDALGGEKDDHGAAVSSSSGLPVPVPGSARHVDRDAPLESVDGPRITGGKHALRD